MTLGIGLDDWYRLGSLQRELALYRRLAHWGWDVTLYTWKPDDAPATATHGLRIVRPPAWACRGPGRPFYPHVLPWLDRAKGSHNAVIMTNQAHGGWPAIRAARLWNARLIARCGMVHGEASAVLGKTSSHARRAARRETCTFRCAELCAVPTDYLAAWIARQYAVPADRIVVVPNYVDTDLFRPLNRLKRWDVLSIGRLVEKKRHGLLLQALAGSGLNICIIGAGKLADDLRAEARRLEVNLTLIDRVDNTELPEFLNASRMYANLSRWEGHPKAMIEAMACGCACIGTRVPGVENLLQDRRTGRLVDADPAAVRVAIYELLACGSLARQLGLAAAEYARRFSLDMVARRHHELLESLCRSGADRPHFAEPVP